jgi:2-keto-4-pentenoate hydratase
MTSSIDGALVERLAARLRGAEAGRTPCPPIRDDIPAGDVAIAYAIQQVNAEHGIRAGRRVVGRKIGLTSRSVQTQLGVDQPDYGVLFADMVVNDGEPIAATRVLQPKAEAEVALVLERDLTVEQPTVVDVIRAVAFALPAIEVVGSRIANWDIRLVDTIADNASSGLIVLGGPPRTLDGLDLRLCGMTLECRGEPVSVGAGASCLGSPLVAAAWLARKMVEVGTPLRAGDVVMTGALGPMVPVAPGDVLEARNSGLGSVRAVFGREGA